LSLETHRKDNSLIHSMTFFFSSGDAEKEKLSIRMSN
jgi:hypothetical protein